MTYREEVLQQALALPTADRVFVVAALEKSLAAAESLSPADSVAATSADAIGGSELLAELQRRSAAHKNGEMTARPAAEVIADLRRKPVSEPSRTKLLA